jgi:hypothetical protein
MEGGENGVDGRREAYLKSVSQLGKLVERMLLSPCTLA